MEREGDNGSVAAYETAHRRFKAGAWHCEVNPHPRNPWNLTIWWANSGTRLTMNVNDVPCVEAVVEAARDYAEKAREEEGDGD